MKIEGREFVPQPKQFHVPELGEVGKIGNLKKEIKKGKDRVKEKDKGIKYAFQMTNTFEFKNQLN